jgi:hypothetical protein
MIVMRSERRRFSCRRIEGRDWMNGVVEQAIVIMMSRGRRGSRCMWGHKDRLSVFVVSPVVVRRRR